MRLLVLHASRFGSIGAIRDYLEGFQAHSRHDVFFMDAGDGAVPQVKHEDFDAVLVNFCCRLHYGSLFSDACAEFVAGFPGIRIVILQDEQENTLTVRKRVAGLRPHILFTTLPPDAWSTVLPKKVFKETRIVRLLTGYARQGSLPSDLSLLPLKERRLTLGYRVTPHVWRWGELGKLKIEVGQRFHQACLERGIPADIAWTEQAKIYGDDWLRFNASCRGVLGSESGASIFDWHGDLQRRETKFRHSHPTATCDDFLAEIAGQEVSFDTGQISPRVFEATITRTALVMVEGTYAGLLQPEKHYLPIKRDFTNIEDVLDRMADLENLQEMADRAYDHLIKSGKFSYKAMAEKIDSEIQIAGDAGFFRKGKGEFIRNQKTVNEYLPENLSFLASYPTEYPLGRDYALKKINKFQNIISELHSVSQLRGAEALAIYGAGDGGKIVHQWLQKNNVKASFFLDSKKNGEMFELPILKISEIADQNRNINIVIASQHFWEIGRNLITSGFKNVFNGNRIIQNETSSPGSVFPYDL